VSELIYETLTEVRFDETQRIAELVDQITTRKLSSITGSGHALAMSAASSGFSPSAKMHHQYGGLEGLVRLKALRDKLEDTAQRSKLLEKFRELHAILLSAPRQFLLVAEPEKEEELTAEIDSFWDKKAQTPEVTPFSLPSTRESVKQAWVTSTQVNFCAYAYPTVGSDHPDHATLQVLAGYLRNGFLHSAIREVGGAYGGGASQDPASASFRFFSYRDPRLGETLADFKASITWLLGDAQQESQLEEAVLGVIASMDKPSSPAGEAKTAFYNRLFGRTLEQRTEFRKRVLATTLEDLKHVAIRYFVDQEPSLAVITSAAKAEELEIEGLEINKI
jgi:Zn-dependent M16 (insulinase) family peptidase